MKTKATLAALSCHTSRYITHHNFCRVESSWTIKWKVWHNKTSGFIKHQAQAYLKQYLFFSSGLFTSLTELLNAHFKYKKHKNKEWWRMLHLRRCECTTRGIPFFFSHVQASTHALELNCRAAKMCPLIIQLTETQ